MLPRERVIKTLKHQKPDIVPWGEHSIHYNIHEDILGRRTFVQAKFRLTKALWEGRRDEVVASYKYERKLTGLIPKVCSDLMIPAGMLFGTS